MIHDVSIYMAFGAGLISFLSPCVLPLVPGYISFISGVSVNEMRRGRDSRDSGSRSTGTVFVNSLFFVLGFSLVFILLGASATWAGRLVSSNIWLLTKIAGAIIVFFGLFKVGLFKLLFFQRQATIRITHKKWGLLGAFLIGAAFGFGWTPCIGPILAGILAYAGTLEKVGQGVGLMAIYALGLGIPFLLAALGIRRFLGFFERIKKHLGKIEVISGIVMVVLGLLIFFNKLLLVTAYLPFLNKFAL
jgi:cytochrome c-type biogenesis protein